MATEKQLAYINDLIAGHVSNLDRCIASWQAWQAERGPSTDAAELVELYTQARPVFAAMSVSPELTSEGASNVIGALKLETGRALVEFAQRRPKAAAALGISVDPAFAMKVYKIGIYARSSR